MKLTNSMLRYISIIILSVCLIPQLYAGQMSVGWVEEVSLGTDKFRIEAKIDTGADNTSINAVNVQKYTKDEQTWVKFSLSNKTGQEINIDQPVVKKTKIKTKSGGWQSRDVIELEICLAGIKKHIPVNLVDRSHFKYQVLIGRSFLRPEFLVDSGKTRITDPVCN